MASLHNLNKKFLKDKNYTAQTLSKTRKRRDTSKFFFIKLVLP